MAGLPRKSHARSSSISLLRKRRLWWNTSRAAHGSSSSLVSATRFPNFCRDCQHCAFAGQEPLQGNRLEQLRPQQTRQRIECISADGRYSDLGTIQRDASPRTSKSIWNGTAKQKAAPPSVGLLHWLGIVRLRDAPSCSSWRRMYLSQPPCATK